MTEMKKIQIAPVRKSVRVKASQAHAFEVFTARIGKWWPIERAKASAGPIVTTTMEPRVGGRWFETGVDGQETTVGHLLVWDPPRRFVVTWEVNCQFNADAAMASEVEVTFTAEGPDTTLVELQHGKFEKMPEGGQITRDRVNEGWPGMLDLFKAAVEADDGSGR
jgi:uncharacterized protein YndB with AHSA1/START domain